MDARQDLKLAALDLDGLPPLDDILENLGADLRGTLKPILGSMPLLFLLNEILELAGNTHRKCKHQALLDLAGSAVAKHNYTRRLYEQLVHSVLSPSLEQAGSTLSDLPKRDAKLAMEVLALMAERLASAELHEQGVSCFQIAAALAKRFRLLLNQAIAIHQLGLYEARRMKFAAADACLREAAHLFSQIAPDLFKRTNLCRAALYGHLLRHENDPPAPDDLEAIMKADFAAGRVVLLARARKALDSGNLGDAEDLCARVRSIQPREVDPPAELLLIEARIARRKGDFEKADFLAKEAAAKSDSDRLDKEISWEAFYHARDLGLNDLARRALERSQEKDDPVRIEYQKALVALHNGDQLEAENLFRCCLESDKGDLVRADCYGMLALVSKNPEDSRRYLYQAIGLYVKQGRKLDHAISLSHLAIIEIVEGQTWKDIGMPEMVVSQFRRADDLLKQAQKIAEGLKSDSFLLDLKMCRAQLEFARERYDVALQLYDEAVTHIEIIYLTLTDQKHAAAYVSRHEALYGMAIRCALEIGRHNEAMLFNERSKARRFLRDVGERIDVTGAPPAHPLLRQESSLLLSIQPLRSKLSQGRPLSVRERRTLYEVSGRLAELRRQLRESPELLRELCERVHQPLAAAALRQVVFGSKPHGEIRKGPLTPGRRHGDEKNLPEVK